MHLPPPPPAAAVSTQNKPLLAFMAECGADLSLACTGPPSSVEFITPAIIAKLQGWHSMSGLIDDLIAAVCRLCPPPGWSNGS